MKKISMLLGILIMIAGCSQMHDKPERAGQQLFAKQKPVKVSVKPVRSENREVEFKYSGTVEPSQSIPLNFRASGTVEKVLVEEGDHVTKGQLLATVDETDAQNMLEITQSKYQQAMDAYNRLKSVYDKGSLPEIKWVEMETNLAQAKSSLELSKNNIEKCKLYAPTGGIIGSRNIEPGMSSVNLSAGAPLEIVDIKTVNIKISVPEKEISKIEKGLKAGIIVLALDNKEFEGEITNVSPVADKFSRTYNAEIKVSNPDYYLKPGMVCDVTIKLPSENSIVWVPYPSVTQDENGSTYVFLVDKSNKQAIKKIIETGNYTGSDIEVLAGLSGGQEVVCEGKYKLNDKSLITW